MMKKILLISCMAFAFSNYVKGQGTCNPAGNIIIYSNYDGGSLTINVDENIPDIRIGICSYESISINITGTYVGNVTQVLYAGYNSGGGTSISGVDAGITEILMYPPVTLYDPDGYPYMICAYECDTNYVPGGCNTVDQAVDYFLTELPGALRYSYFQYGVYSGEYAMSDGGNCCLGAACTTTIDAGQDETICVGDSVQLEVGGAIDYAWSPVTGLSNTEIGNPFAFPETTTTYVVTGTDADGCTGIDSITVYVNPLPVADIDVSGTTLTATGGGTYQWYVDGAAIPGATNATYTVTANGAYSVEVTSDEGCTDMSGAITMVVNGIDAQSALAFTLYPNPARNIVYLQVPVSSATISYRIENNNGQVVAQGNYTDNGIAVDQLADGIYTIRVRMGNAEGVQSFILDN